MSANGWLQFAIFSVVLLLTVRPVGIYLARVLEGQRTRQRCERIATIGIFDRAKIVGDQPQLVVAAGLVSEAIEQFGEAVHASPPSDAGTSPSPLSSSP